MKWWRSAYLLGFYLFGSSFFAQEVWSADTPPDFTMEIFVKSGLAKQIEFLPVTIEAGINNAFKSEKDLLTLPPTFVDQYIKLARQSYTVEYLSDSILAYLDRQFSQYEMREIIEWLESTVGREFTKLEKKSTERKEMEGMQAFTRQINASPPSKLRLALIRKLNRATKASDSSLVVLMTAKLAIEMAKHKVNSPHETASPIILMKMIALERQKLEDEIMPLVIKGLLYTYRSVGNEDLQKYIKFAQSGIGTRYHSAILGAYNSALIDASALFGESIKTL